MVVLLTFPAVLGTSACLPSTVLNFNKQTPKPKKLKAVKTKKVTVTAYSLGGHLPTASGMRLRKGTMAVSRNLKKQGFTFGSKVHVPGLGVLTVVDLMPAQWHNRIDIWMPHGAKQFGVLERVPITLLEG